jgi:hypothetical protein
VRLGILGLLFVTAAACSPAQRTAAGVGVGLVGAGVAYGAADLMVPSCGARREPGQGCTQHPEPLSPQVGFPLVLGGIGVVVLGGLIVATAGGHGAHPAKDVHAVTAPPEEVAALDETEAVGMAVAEYMLVGLHRNAKPAKLLNVDETQVTLQANERHAELFNLRIRAGADESWRVVGACYEYEHEWRVTSVGTTLECAR